MKTLNKIALIASLAIATLGLTNTASAQDSGYWAEGSISPWGMEMYDQYGDSHFVDPYAYDSQVDYYGNVYSSDSGYMDPQIGMNDLYHTNPYATDTYSSGYDTSTTSTYVPYSNPTSSHESFINSIWE